MQQCSGLQGNSRGCTGIKNAQMLSYPPTLDELKAAFISENPECTKFKDVVVNMYNPVIIPVPFEDHGQIIQPICMQLNHKNYDKWMMYIRKQSEAISKEANVGYSSYSPPGLSHDGLYNGLWVTIYQYQKLCACPSITPEARIQRERTRELNRLKEAEKQKEEQVKRAADLKKSKEEEEKKRKDLEQFHLDLANAKEWASQRIQLEKEEVVAKNENLAATRKDVENKELVISHKKHKERLERILTLTKYRNFTQSEADAILAYIYPVAGFNKDTLVALKALNRYATSNGIRVEDAITVIKELV